MSKIAICFTGYPACIGKAIHEPYIEDENIITLSYETLNKHILSCNDVDIFIHTWLSDLAQKYIDVYKPYDYIIDQQPQSSDYSFTTNETIQLKLQAINARTYAILKVISLVLQSGNDYSHILITRPDLYWLKNLQISDLDNSFIYISDWWHYGHKNLVNMSRDDLYMFAFQDFKPGYASKLGYPLTKSINDAMFLMNTVNAKLFSTIFALQHDFLTFIFNTKYFKHDKFSEHFFFFEVLRHFRFFETNKILLSFKLMQDYMFTRDVFKAKKIAKYSGYIVNPNIEEMQYIFSQELLYFVKTKHRKSTELLNG